MFDIPLRFKAHSSDISTQKINIFEIGKWRKIFLFRIFGNQSFKSSKTLFSPQICYYYSFFKGNIFWTFQSKCKTYFTSALQPSCKQVHTLPVLTNYNQSLLNFPSPIYFLRDYLHQRRKSKLENVRSNLLIFFF